uniref:Uncharacterized protein n=1 Tax=Ixodes ricinus TaxID=34613 RepID=A0A6B0UG76_IXORI
MPSVYVCASFLSYVLHMEPQGGKKEKLLVCDVRLKKFRCVVGWCASVPDWKQLCEIRCVHFFFVVLEDFFFSWLFSLIRRAKKGKKKN